MAKHLHIEYLILEDLRGHLVFFIKLEKKEKPMDENNKVFHPGRLGTYSLQFKTGMGQKVFGNFNVFPVEYYVKKSHELTQAKAKLFSDKVEICLCYEFRDLTDAMYSSPLFKSCDTKEYRYEPKSSTKIITTLPVAAALDVLKTKSTTARNLLQEVLNDFTFLQNDKDPEPYKKLRERQESYLYTENDKSDVILKHVLRNHYFIPENMMANYLPFFKNKLKTKTYKEFSKDFFRKEEVERKGFETIDANECVELMVNLKNPKKGDKRYIEHEGMLFPNPEVKNIKKRGAGDTDESSKKKQKADDDTLPNPEVKNIKKRGAGDTDESSEKKQKTDDDDFPDINIDISAKESLVDAMQRLLNSFSDSDDD